MVLVHLQHIFLHFNLFKTLLDIGLERQSFLEASEDVLYHVRWVEVDPALLRVPVIRDQRSLVDDVPVVVCQKVEVSARFWLFLSV